jgi:hypothetical protein
VGTSELREGEFSRKERQIVREGGESACERLPRGLPRGKRARRNGLFLLRIEESPRLAAESFNPSRE